MFVIQIPTVQYAHNEKEFTHALKSRQVNVTWPDRTLIKRRFFTLEEKDGVFELFSKMLTTIKRPFYRVTGKGWRVWAVIKNIYRYKTSLFSHYRKRTTFFRARTKRVAVSRAKFVTIERRQRHSWENICNSFTRIPKLNIRWIS